MSEIKNTGLFANFTNLGSDKSQNIHANDPSVPAEIYSCFITWKAVEELIVGNIGYTTGDKIDDCEEEKGIDFATYQKGTSQPTVPGIPQEAQISSKKQDDDIFFNSKLSKFPIINSDEVKINYIDGVFSTDVFVCIIPIETPAVLTFSGDAVKVNLASPVNPEIYKSFKISPIDNKIHLKDILVNVGFFYECYKRTESLSELLLAILNGISDACGNLWDFQLMIDERNSSAISIIDTKTVSEDANQDAEKFKYFKIYNKESFVRKATLNTNVPANIKNSIMLDAFLKYDKNNKDVKDYQQIGFRHLFDETVESLLKEDKFRSIKPGENLVKQAQTLEVESSNANTKKTTSISEQLFKVYFELSKGRTQEVVDRAKQILKTYLALFIKDKNNIPLPHKNFVLFPLELTLTVDGISGLVWGNKIMIDYIPKRYIDNSVFQIKNIKHDINTTDWTTEIETIWRCIQKEDTLQNVSQGNQSTQLSDLKQECWGGRKHAVNPKKRKDNERIVNGKYRPYFPDRGNMTKNKKYRNGEIPLSSLKTLSFNKNVQLDPKAIGDLESLNISFKRAFGINLPIGSGYRSFGAQVLIHERKIEEDKCYQAAEPGFSDHGIGLAIDMNTSIFTNNGTYYKWFKQNAINWTVLTTPDEFWHWSFDENLASL